MTIFPAPGSASIAVIGCGHVGVVTAAGLAALGHRVTGVDKSAVRVAELCRGEIAFQEPGLNELVAEGLESGRLSFTTSYEAVVPEVQVIFLAVDTPATPSGAADLGNIRAATRSISAALNGTIPLIVNKSTSPIGTGETIEAVLRAGLTGKQTPRIASNPEFLRQGMAVHDFFHPERIVIGARSPSDASAVAALYGGIDAPFVMTDLRTAEMIKYVANSFLATRVSFINEMARLCEQLEVDVDQVVEGVALDDRIGRHFFRPGIGFGGSCLPKDVAALRYVGESLGVATPLLAAVEEINQAQRTSAVRKLRRVLGSLEGRVICVWGLTFKGGTEDVRESPAIDVVELLRNEGAILRLYDPTMPGNLPESLAPLLQDDPIEAAQGAEVLAVLTDWASFKEVPLTTVRAVMHGDLLFDGRNLLERAACEAAGFRYLGVGRTATPARSAVA